MKLANYAKINVFVKENENEEEIRQKLLSLLPFSPEDEKIRIERTTATGFNEAKIIILEIELEKDKHLNNFIFFIAEKLSKDQKALIRRQAELRIDAEFNFFIRLDKEKLLEDKYWITDSGNCFHIKINIACFPRKREKAIKLIEEIFK